MAPIAFNDVPSGTLVPFFFAEFDSTAAQQGPSVQPFELLLIGQRLATGTVAAEVPVSITSPDQARESFGAGSQLHAMAVAVFANAKDVPVRAIALDDPGGGVKATATLQATAAPTAAGSFYVYVAGERLEVTVTAADTVNTVATAIADAVNARTDLQVTAAAVTDTATLTAKHAGVIGNDLGLELNYNEGETLPTGLAVTVTGFASGAGTVDLGDVWADLDDEAPNVWAVGDSGSANLTELVTELDERFGPIEQREALAFVGLSDTHANLVTTGSGQNSRNVCLIGAEGSPSSPWVWASAFAAVVATNGKRDVARPFQTLPVRGLVPPKPADRFDFTERNLLLDNGVGTFTVDRSGLVRVERVVTTYQTSPAGSPDPSYLDANTLLQLGYVRFDARTRTANRFPRAKVMADGTALPAGQSIVTPSVYRAFLVDLCEGWAELGIVEDVKQFARDLVVEVDATDPNRLNVLASPNLVNQWRQTGVRFAFIL